MELTQLTNEIKQHLLDGDSKAISTALSDIHPSVIADVIEQLEPEDHTFILKSLDPEIVSEIYFELNSEYREDISEKLNVEELADIADEMDSDDAADLIGELPEGKAKKVLSSMDPEEAKDVEPLLKYPEDSAGGIMQAELVKVTSDSTVSEAINWIRLIADDVEEFHGIYITDDNDILLGSIPLHNLILANPQRPVTEIMETVDVTITPLMDQEKVAEYFKQYDVISLPVVDENNKLLGRITADDIIDVISQEAEEDLYKLTGLGEHLHPIYTPTKERIKLRIPWLVLTLIGELLIAFIIIKVFQPTLQKVAILAAFMPAIMATGGNVGIQTTTIIVRSLGLGTIDFKQVIKLILAEVKVGFALGLICGLLTSVIGTLISFSQPEIFKLALAVFIAMVSATMATSFVGVAGPLLLHKLRLDPAASSGPFLTMFNDIFGSLFYLLVAMLIF
ncbi:MAG: magnesium transporter [Candidatus Dadabacteria bacterium]|nr:magnesium transporter [Candidatus Dadabacteria bacterium]NIQ13213.1 magnesium transporter [Candidatus Dadabacteria bacterium]